MLQHNGTYGVSSRRLDSIDSYLDGLSEYTHDNTDQLTGADHTGQTNESYTYDENGNRTMTGHSIGDNNRLLSDGTHNYTYDDEGNRLTKTKISTGEKEEYTWDHRNRLTKVTFKNSGGTVLKTVDHSYDVFNRWIRRSVDADGPGAGTAVDTFFSHEGGQVALQFAGSTASTLSHRRLWNPAAVDQLLADESVTSLTTPGVVQYPLGDHLGTLRDLATYNAGTNVTTIANHRRYDSYGNLVSETASAVDQMFGYTGRALDESTGLQNNHHRWYSPDLGRWLSEDPIGFAAGDLNLSRYVGNGPTNRVDPSGLVWAGDWWNYWFTGRISPEQEAQKNKNRESLSLDSCQLAGSNAGMRYSAEQFGEMAIEAERQAEATAISVAMVFIPVGGVGGAAANNAKKPSISACKCALKKAYAEVGKLPKGNPGKWGSPTRGTTIKGYRLDPPHPKAPAGSPESCWHLNWWDYTKGSRSSGLGQKGSIPIVD